MKKPTKSGSSMKEEMSEARALKSGKMSLAQYAKSEKADAKKSKKK